MEHSQNNNPLKNPEYLIAFGVVLISVCALVVSIRQTTIMSEQRALMHQQAKAAVWPRLAMSVGKSHSIEDNSVTDYRITVSNAGVGPAIIKYVNVSFKGQPVSNWWELFRKFEMDENIPLYITNSTISQSIIRQGDDLRILSLGDNLPLAQEFLKNSGDITFEIFYESIYGDMWKYSAGLTSSDDTTESIETDLVFSQEEEFKS
ncbi:MAG: hypothetical protein RIM99_09225 [Cyclobacteriaceae bacterium]